MKTLKQTAIACATNVCLAASTMAAELTIATVNNGHMIEMQKLAGEFVAENPGTSINWVTLDEGTLRARVTDDIQRKGGQFDVLTIGMYEAPIWGSRGWLEPLDFGAAYDLDDLLPAIRDGLSYDGTLFAAPFYGESSMIMYRSDLVAATGRQMADNPAWTEIREFAADMHDPARGTYGICLRGKPGWGDNMAFVTTMANSFGAQWFNRDWTPALDSDAWREALGFYVDLLNDYGPPGAENMSFNEILSLFNQGRCGMWIDATIAASFISDPGQSSVADRVAFAQAPQAVTTKGANWLWAWALAVPEGSRNVEEAKSFVEWATSKDYINLVGQRRGWGAVPTGTRTSTYQNPSFQAEAVFYESELRAIQSANPNDSTLRPSPYTGVQFAAIPEFQSIGGAVADLVASALTGEISVDEALQRAQAEADRQMRAAGYY